MKNLRLFAITTLILAILGVLLTPFAMAEGYSWFENSISETGGQGVSNAWLGRLTLTLSGLGVLAVAKLRRNSWSRITFVSMTLFGVMWSLTAVFSTQSWEESVPFNPVESAIHSALASAMAIVVLGALAIAFQRPAITKVSRYLAFTLAAAATFLPLASLLNPEFAGLFQRLMFVITQLWFIREAKQT
jgi:hypothetical membrane protein